MTSTREAVSSARIRGLPVPPLVAPNGTVHVLIVGEAPGPRGADKSGVPFFGDGAGKHLYRALRDLRAVDLPDAVDGCKWDGQALIDNGFRPVACDISLTNAFDRCPTDDGKKFRAPSRAELEGEANTNRIRREIDALKPRGLSGIVTLGKVATRTMQSVSDEFYSGAIPVHALPHPSAQGLLSMAPNRGKGAKMADLHEQWMAHCMQAIIEAGYAHANTESD